ncbi:MAG: low molecular weight protein-tyrosine-phosphatase [Burkholderiales bacterium]
MQTRRRVLFVCMGNICRSPTAEGVFRRVITEAAATGRIDCDSAGTHGYHVGEPPDARAQTHAAQRGYDLSGLRARKVEVADFTRFDLVLAMDRTNLALLRELCPPRQHRRVALYGDFSVRYPGQDVPDPYYGGARGFEQVLDMIEETSQRLLQRLTEPPAIP